MNGRRYRTVDVFTLEQFRGNPLAVVLDAKGLTDTDMQRIAIEFNYSETTFVLPPADPANTACVRIFTPGEELPFAGHPNIGTAFVLACEGATAGDVPEAFRFEEGAGLVPVAVERGGGAVIGARLTAPAPLALGQAVPESEIAGSLGIGADRIVADVHHPVEASVGTWFVFAELRKGTLEMLQPAAPELERQTQRRERFKVFAYERRSAHELEARMFWHAGQVREDPATGSGVAALAGLLAHLAPAGDGVFPITVQQGLQMDRASLLFAEARKRDGVVVAVDLWGRCVPVAEGVLRLTGRD